MISPERRSAERRKQHASVCISVDQNNYGCDIQLHDISLDGMMVQLKDSVGVNRNCLWEITLTGPSSRLSISGKGRIVRQDPRGIAIKFTELELDSYTFLKNIVFGNSLPDNA